MRRVKEIFLGCMLPIITVLTIDILVIAILASFMPMKWGVMVVLTGTSLGLLIGAFSDRGYRIERINRFQHDSICDNIANHICYGMGFRQKRQATSYRGRTYNSWNYICRNLFGILGCVNMEMKWHPIVNGDLSGIQQQETLLFTLIDERQNENYVTTGWILENEGKLEVRGVDPWGLNSNETKKVKAWMELPSPFHPNDCNMCAHYMVWTDEFGDRLSKCELWNESFAMADCPLR